MNDIQFELVNRTAIDSRCVKSTYKIKSGGNINVVSKFKKSDYKEAILRAAVASSNKKNTS